MCQKQPQTSLKNGKCFSGTFLSHQETGKKGKICLFPRKAVNDHYQMCITKFPKVTETKHDDLVVVMQVLKNWPKKSNWPWCR